LIKHRVTYDNVIGDHVVGKQTLVFDTESLNRWLEERATGSEYQVRRMFGMRVPEFHIESFDTVKVEEDTWRLLMS